MLRLISSLIAAVFVLAACTISSPEPTGGIRVYKISARDTGKIQFRLLDGVNALRQAAGVAPLQLNPQLTAAAATHAQDMAVQNRPWHFGSDGSSPLDRVRRAGYSGILMGENISETYETELETLAAWMDEPATRSVILDSDARDLGFAWFQEKNGKIWWTLVTGGQGVVQAVSEIPTVISQ